MESLCSSLDTLRLCVCVCVYSLLIQTSAGNVVTPSCDREADNCSFELTVSEKYTMMWYAQRKGQMLPVVINETGVFTRQRDCSVYEPLPPREMDVVVIADGAQKLSLLVNGQLPGPPIVVYEGQQVVVNVTNDITNEAITIHWHGIFQKRSPWMDGVASLSQCSISPETTFTYRFIAEPVGTHWYHSHLGTQMSMGVYGPLIVLPKQNRPQNAAKVDDKPAGFAKEFYMVLQDWMRENSAEILEKIKHEAVSYGLSFNITDDQCFDSTKQSDGFDAGVYLFNSIIVNGKGRHYKDNEVENPHIPLETYNVVKGGKYRFRVICAALLYALQVSIDGHALNIISTDGHDVITKQVDSLIVFSGERYDFWIDATDRDGLGNYWIRVETIERFQNGRPYKPGHAEAVLRYSTSPLVDPRSRRRVCSQAEPCVTLNCPYESYPDSQHTICVPVSDLRSTSLAPTLSSRTTGLPFQEVFLNFHFSFNENLNVWKPTVNGYAHKHHLPPLQVQPTTRLVTPCEDSICRPDYCRCTHLIKLPLQTVVQFVITTTVNNPVGVLNGNVHPIHLHGHQFQVIKIGYAHLDPVSKIFTGHNSDITCVNNDNRCNQVTWSDPAWRDGNVSDIVERGATYKDTVAIPAAGYAVVRFITDNPGFWYMHCHIEPHNEEGMALVVQAGEAADMNPAPEHMTSCGNSRISGHEFLDRLRSPGTDVSKTVQLDALNGNSFMTKSSTQTYRILTFVFAGICLSLLCVILFMYKQLRRYNGYVNIPGEETIASGI